MSRAILELAGRLAGEGRPYALATVVRREAPTSAQVGDAAIILPDGTFRGWVGGSCTRPTVVREALAALADGRARLIALDPDPSATREEGVTVLPMTCHSRGRVDVYIEPVLPAPKLVVFGVTPVARALARLGAAMGWTVTAVDPDADRETFPDAAEIVAGPDAAADGGADGGPAPSGGPLYAVVATQGQWDEGATRRALAMSPRWLGVVASRRRFEEIRVAVEGAGTEPAAVAGIANPAGLDIGARSAGEIAVSILAQIVRDARAVAPEAVVGPGGEGGGFEGEAPDAASAPRESEAGRGGLPLHPFGGGAPAGEAGEVDVVCGMRVIPGPGAPRVEYEGRTYWFCCGHCREAFASDPAAHATAARS